MLLRTFEGQIRQKKPQILDRTEKVTKETILSKARWQRQQFKDDNLQRSAAQKLQAFVRGFICRSNLSRDLHEALRTQTDAISFHLQELQSHSNPDDLTSALSVEYLCEQFAKLLRLLNWLCRRRVDKPTLLSICRILLSKLGPYSVTCLLSANWPHDQDLTLWRTISVILRYLVDLSPQTTSTDYNSPLRVLEEVLSPHRPYQPHTDDANTKSVRIHRDHHLRTFLSRNGYFRTVALFIERQLPPTSGHINCDVSSGTNEQTYFDPVEFMQFPRTRALIDVLLLPLSGFAKFCVTHPEPHYLSLLQRLLVHAMNDLLVADQTLGGYEPTERTIRGLATRVVVDVPFAVQLLSSYKLYFPSNTTASSSSSTSFPYTVCWSGQVWSTMEQTDTNLLVPSHGLLYLYATVMIPQLLNSDLLIECADSEDHVTTQSPSSSSSSSLSSSSAMPILNRDVLLEHSVRCLAWLLMRLLFQPSMPCVSPLKPPQPSDLRADSSLSNDDDDDDDDDVTSARSSSQSNSAKTSWHLEAVYSSLRRVLPLLAVHVLSKLQLKPQSQTPANNNVFQADANLSPLCTEQHEMVWSLAQLHFALAELDAAPSSVMVKLNSIYSQYPVFLRLSWDLVRSTDVFKPFHKTSMNSLDGKRRSLFHHLATGTLPQPMTVLQRYLPLVFTFSVCLRHRLLCSTDAELRGDFEPSPMMIDPSSSSTRDVAHQERLHFNCGFSRDELLFIGSQLRDLLLGILDLAHPSQLPQPDRDQNTVLKTQSDYQAMFNRIEQRMNTATNARDSPSLARSSYANKPSPWTSHELWLQLHCWCTLFLRVQRVVFQLYDWDRRCFRRQLTARDYFSNNTTLDQSVWLKEHAAASVQSSLAIWIQQNGWKHISSLFDKPFGYYSQLYPHSDMNAQAFSLREIRQLVSLKEIPFVIPFESRVRLFQLLVASSRNERTQVNRRFSVVNYLNRPSISLTVRRSHLYEDAFDKLSKENEPDLQRALRVQFMNMVGLEEMGIDGGGLLREFLSDLLMNGCDPNRGFFVYTTERTLYPNPHAALLTKDYLKHYFFLGRMLAKALYEGMLVELPFAHFFLAKIVSRTGGCVGFDYLHSRDPEMYRQLQSLKNYHGNVEDLELDFTVTRDLFGQSDTVELKHNGHTIPVTEENRVEYMHLVAHHMLNKEIHSQVRAFIDGLNDVICIDWFRLFDADELQTLISGSDTSIDVDDLERHTVYANRSEAFEETINHFWSVLRDLSESDKRLFLRFVTASSRPPMFGFQHLYPPFSLQLSDELDRFPTASTCINQLRVPNYRNQELLRERLLYALHAGAGFEYS